ncbi:unnamed protein product, partial [Pylaiella littoralis]
ALSCTTAGVTKRRAYTPAKGASVHRVPGDGGCGWTAMHGGLQHCLGKTKTPSVQQMKSAVVKRATEHTVGKTHHVGQSTTVVLSPEQLTRGRELRMPELIGDEPAPDRRTVGWYHSCATSCVFSDNKIWLDISWLALLSAE